VSSLKTATPISDIGTLIEDSIGAINLPNNAFDFGTGWARRGTVYEKYNAIFNSNGTITVYTNSTAVEK